MSKWQTTSLWLMVALMGARFLGLLQQALLARVLLPSAYGVFAQAMAYAGMFAPLSDAGVSALIVRHLSRRARATALLRSAVALRLVTVCMTWAVTTGSAAWLSKTPEAGLAVAVASAYWGVASFQQLAAAVARARAMAHLEAGVVLVERVVALLLATGGAFYGGAVGAIVGVLVAGGVSCSLLVRGVQLPLLKVKPYAWKRLLGVGFPLAVADLCHAVIMRLDLLAVASRYGAQSAGWYGSASLLVWAAVLVPGSMALALVPAYASAQDSRQALPQQAFAKMTTLALALATVIGLGAESWVHLLYGEAYQPTAEVLKVLAWCVVPASVVAWGNAMLLVHRRVVVVGVVAAGGASSLWLGVWLVGGYGIVAIAVAQLAVQTAMAAALWWACRRLVAYKRERNR